MGFAGFPRKVRYTPVPNPVFGPLLEQIDDLAELKCTLRLLWLLHQKRGFPRSITLRELLSDRVLVRSVGDGEEGPAAKIRRALSSGVERGVFLSRETDRGGVRDRIYLLNTESDRKALSESGTDESLEDGAAGEGPPVEAIERPNIFGMYEENIGMLSPMIAEELKEAEVLYPHAWIEDAFREAVGQNKRSWRYISAILERWEREGRGDGGPGRHPKAAGHERYLGR
jgi:DnaD/phage-associated family protein